jgi:hypothetical protein
METDTDEFNHQLGNIAGILSDTNRIDIKHLYSDRFDPILAVYAVKFSPKKLIFAILFNVCTLMIFLPLLIFFPALRNTICFDSCPDVSKANYFLLKLAGGLFKLKKRYQHAVNPEVCHSFVYQKILYVYDASEKCFKQRFNNLLKYQPSVVEQICKGGQLKDEDWPVLEEIHFSQISKKNDIYFQRIKDLAVLIFINVFNVLVNLFQGQYWFFAIGGMCNLLTMFFLLINKYLPDEPDEATFLVSRLQANTRQPSPSQVRQRDLAIGDIIELESTTNKEFISTFEGLLLEGQSIKIQRDHVTIEVKKVNAEAGECGSNSIENSRLLIKDFVSLDDKTRRLLVTKTLPKDDILLTKSRKALNEALKRCVFFLFIPIWSLYFIYYWWKQRSSLWQVMLNCATSFSPFLILVPSMPSLVLFLRRRVLNNVPTGIDEDIIDLHFNDKLIERPNKKIDLKDLRITCEGRILQTQDLEDPELVTFFNKYFLTRRGIGTRAIRKVEFPVMLCGEEQFSIVSAQYPNSETIEVEIAEKKKKGSLPDMDSAKVVLRGQHSLSEEQCRHDVEEGLTRYTLSIVKADIQKDYTISFAAVPVSADGLVDKILDSFYLNSILSANLKAGKPFISISCLSTPSSVLISLCCFDSQQAEPQYRLVFERFSTTTKDLSAFSRALKSRFDGLQRQDYSLYVSGDLVEMLSWLPVRHLGNMIRDRLRKGECKFYDLKDKDLEGVRRVALSGGMQVILEDSGDCETLGVKMCESRVIYSVSVSLFKMMASLSLINLTSMNILTEAEGGLTEKELLCLSVMILFPMMLASSFSKRQPFLINEGTSNFFRTERIILSILGNTVIQFIFQNLMLKALKNQFFYILPELYAHHSTESFDNSSIFKISLFLSVGSISSYCIEDPFKTSVWRNKYFTFMIFHELTLILLLCWSRDLGIVLLGLVELPVFFDTVIVVLGFLAIQGLVTFEDKLVNRSIVWKYCSKIFN